MLDSYGRKYVQSWFEKAGDWCVQQGWTPTQLTLAALACGIGVALAILGELVFIALLLLWVSGLCDVLDGTVARKTGRASKSGAFLDIVCDRAVEVSVILALAWQHPEAHGALLVLCTAIICSLTIFLTSAAIVPNTSEKSLHYQAGLIERTEGFIFFSLMLACPGYMAGIAWIFASAVFATAVQRFWWTLRFIKD